MGSRAIGKDESLAGGLPSPPLSNPLLTPSYQYDFLLVPFCGSVKVYTMPIQNLIPVQIIPVRVHSVAAPRIGRENYFESVVESTFAESLLFWYRELFTSSLYPYHAQRQRDVHSLQPRHLTRISPSLLMNYSLTSTRFTPKDFLMFINHLERSRHLARISPSCLVSYSLASTRFTPKDSLMFMNHLERSRHLTRISPSRLVNYSLALTRFTPKDSLMFINHLERSRYLARISRCLVSYSLASDSFHVQRDLDVHAR